MLRHILQFKKQMQEQVLQGKHVDLTHLFVNVELSSQDANDRLKKKISIL